MNQRPKDARPICWVLSDGKAGNETQALALAEALGLEPQLKQLAARPPWRWLPPAAWLAPLSALDRKRSGLLPPWPDLLISSGRQTVAPARAIRAESRGRTFGVQILDPRIAPRHFDLVVAPEHDRLSGANVLTSCGALNRVTPARLAAAAEHWATRLAHLPQPRIAVLIGGASRRHRFTTAAAARLAVQLTQVQEDQGVGLMVTASRRSDPATVATLRDGLQPAAMDFWDGQGENPYLGYLALAEAIVVTADSVTMVSEAATTGKPVHVVAMEGGGAKFERFHQALRRDGITRPFDGRIGQWDYPCLDEAARIAAEVRRHLDARSLSE